VIRLRQVHGVTAAGDQRHHAGRREAREPERMRSEPGVVSARHGKDGASDRGDRIPQRFLSSGSAEAQARRQAGGAVTEAFISIRFIPQPLEERPMQPRLEKALDVAGGFELVGQRLVRSAPYGAPLWIFDAAGRADQRGAADAQVRLRQHVQCDPGTQRVPDEPAGHVTDCATDGVRHEPAARGEVGPDGIGTPVPRKVEGDEGERVGQAITEATPEPPRLRETVQQRQWWPRTPQFDLEGHAG
jgi:hypothetical protein